MSRPVAASGGRASERERLPMKIDGGIGFDPDGIAAQAVKAEESGYDGVWSAETNHDPFLPIAIGAAATEKLEFGTGHRGRLRPQPHDAGRAGQRPAAADQGPLHARHGQPDQAAHHEALLHAVVAPGAAHAGAHPGHPGHLEHLGDRRAARLPRRVLHAHVDDARSSTRARTRTATPRSCWPPSASS